MYNLVADATFGEMMDVVWGYATGDLVADVSIFVLAVLMLLGASLMLLAGVGLMRLPDLPTRMHASTKAGSLGAALIMAAVAVAIPEASVWARALAVIAFLLLTAPVAAHIIGRAGYFTGVPLWEGTVKDDLADRYDYEMHSLGSGRLANRKIEGWHDDEEVQRHEPYDPLVDGPPKEGVPHPHPVEQTAGRLGAETTGDEEVTSGDIAAEKAEGKSHPTPAPEQDVDEEVDVGDYAGESAERQESTTDEVSKADADVADQDGDEESDDGGETEESDGGEQTEEESEAEESEDDDGQHGEESPVGEETSGKKKADDNPVAAPEGAE